MDETALLRTETGGETRVRRPPGLLGITVRRLHGGHLVAAQVTGSRVVRRKQRRPRRNNGSRSRRRPVAVARENADWRRGALELRGDAGVQGAGEKDEASDRRSPRCRTTCALAERDRLYAEIIEMEILGPISIASGKRWTIR